MPKEKKTPPAVSPEARENQLIALAEKLVEQRLREGTATATEILHYLKLGSSRERVEKEILEKQKQLLDAKTESLQSQKKTEELYRNAIEAMRIYSGNGGADEEDV